MSCGSKKTPPPDSSNESSLPPCCRKGANKNEKPVSPFNPKAMSSMIENESFPEIMSFNEEAAEENEEEEDEIIDISPITSAEESESAKPACCKTKTLSTTKPRIIDPSITYAPLPPPGGNYGLSQSMAQSVATARSRSPQRNATYDVRQPGPAAGPGGATYHATGNYASSDYPSSDYASREYTDVGPYRNFQIPANLVRRNIPGGANKSFPLSHVPRPSRNYSTYGDPQPILDLKETAQYWRAAPRYFSTPQSAGFRGGEGLDQSTLWGQDQSSFAPTMDFTPYSSDGSSGWSQGVRMDSFNVIKYMTPSPKNVKVPPRLNQSYAPAATGQRISPPYANLSLPQQKPAVPLYFNPKMMSGTQPSRPQSSQLQGTFVRPQSAQTNATFVQGPQSAQVDTTFAIRPQSNQMNATYIQRPQSAQMNATYVQRPQSAQMNATYVQRPQSAQMNATYLQRPQTAQMNATYVQRPQSAQLQQPVSSLPPCCQTKIPPQRPNTADATFRKPDGDTCTDGTCDQKKKPTEEESDAFNDNTFDREQPESGGELALYQPPQSADSTFDTLLEIRTPHKSGLANSGRPLILSINVSCADKSVVVTPDKRYNVLNTTYSSSSPPEAIPRLGPGRQGPLQSVCPGDMNAYNRASRCCQCP